MINFILISIICFCILILVAENSNPDGMKIIYKYIWKKTKEYWKYYDNFWINTVNKNAKFYKCNKLI